MNEILWPNGIVEKTSTPDSGQGTSDAIAREFDASAAEIRATVARVETALIQVVHREVRRAFEDAMSSAKGELGTHAEDTHRGEARNPEDQITPSRMPQDSDEALEPESFDDSPRPDADEVSEELPEPSDDELYEGMVRLNVTANGCARQVVYFIDGLSRRSEFRLLRMVGNHRNKGADIWLGLRQPLSLKTALHDMEGVASVDALLGHGPAGYERLLNVSPGKGRPAGQL